MQTNIGSVIALTVTLAGCLSGGRHGATDGGDMPTVDVGTGDTRDATRNCDQDGDGYAAIDCDGLDCNDLDSSVHPGAPEICGNGIDDNCNGLVDEGCATGGAAVGSACTSSTECGPYGGMSAQCITQSYPATAATCPGQPSGFPNGFCVALCAITGAIDCSACGGCPVNTSCALVRGSGGQLPVCLPNCNPAVPGNDVCRDDSSATYGHYACYDLGGGSGACWAGCYPGPSAGSCDPLHCLSPAQCGARSTCCLPTGQTCTTNGVCCSGVCSGTGTCY